MLLIQSCTTAGLADKIEFRIVNQSNQSLSEIQLKTSDSLATHTLERLSKGESFRGKLDMGRCTSDGDYVLSFKGENGHLTHQDFGYYTNGSPLEHRLIFTILPDTILFETK